VQGRELHVDKCGSDNYHVTKTHTCSSVLPHLPAVFKCDVFVFEIK